MYPLLSVPGTILSLSNYYIEIMFEMKLQKKCWGYLKMEHPNYPSIYFLSLKKISIIQWKIIFLLTTFLKIKHLTHSYYYYCYYFLNLIKGK